MKLIDLNRNFVDAKGNPLPEVVHDTSVDGALAGLQFDGVMLNLVDFARLERMTDTQLRLWLINTKMKIRISFDPGVVK